jgi:two-component system CheB/CheR fusion protein
MASELHHPGVNEAPPESPPHDLIVVGLGASAGGINALKEFFTAMPADSGMAFVVVLHLSAEHESSLASILQIRTTMPVAQVADSATLEPNRVYVIPPNRYLALRDGTIGTTVRGDAIGSRVAIDLFFRSLADSYGRNAVCIVLSGTGSDGTAGLKRIKENNGFAIVQDPGDAEFDAMPLSAIGTNLVDWVLPVHDMPRKLVQLRESSERLKLTTALEEPVDLEGEELLQELLTLIRVRSGHDFTSYKRPTLLRRIARHLQIHELEDISAYLRLVEERPDEMQSLIRNLLINVTNFFRDPEAFDSLDRNVLPGLFAARTREDTIRVWSAGCASGEEAYSLAILLSEWAERVPDPPRLQVFATDIDDEAIAEARKHRYGDVMEADVSPERLERFFLKEHDGYRVRKELREMVLFAPHDFLRDPPFSKLDLVVCRNVLIYLNRATQERALRIFHFALNPGGHLFLGNSETADIATMLYAPIDTKHRIHARRPTPAYLHDSPPPRTATSGAPPARPGRHETIDFGALHYKVVEQYAPPSVLLNDSLDVVHVSASAGRFLHIGGGVPTASVFKVVHVDLIPELRAALYEVKREATTSTAPGVRVALDGRVVFVNLTVRRVDMPEAGGPFLLVLFEEVSEAVQSEQVDVPTRRILDKDDALQTVVGRLDEELRRTQERLRQSLEQHDTSVEELKASNEELQSTNEELRSATEELETSKEELQTVNEELTTVNHELKDHVDELSRANSDLSNLMASTDIGTIFLDRDLNIKRFTPKARELINIIPSDVGRPIRDLTHRLHSGDWLLDTVEVLHSQGTLEREVSAANGRYYLARVTPYRTLEDRVDGVVLTFVDITERKLAVTRLRESEARLRRALQVDSVGVIFFDRQRRITEANPAFLRMSGYSAEDVDHGLLRWDDLTPPEFRERSNEAVNEFNSTGESATYEKQFVCKDGTRRWGLFSTKRFSEDEGVEYVVDISERVRFEEALREADRRKDEFLATLAHELRNPLAPIRAGLEVMRNRNSRDAGQLAREIIERQTEHLVGLVNDLLDVARIARGKIELHRRRIPLSDAIASAIEATKPQLDASGHSLTVTLAEPPIYVDADLMRLSQVFVNVLNNAAKYTDAGGSITISTERTPIDAIVRIRDTGQGIPRDQLERIFESFAQRDSQHRLGGLGIGLSLVQKLVSLHGGQVTASSEGEGKGSEFVITLPLAASQRPAPEPAPTPGEYRTEPSLDILIVDDNRDAADMLGVLLTMRGHTVSTAYDGASGYEAARRRSPDVAMLDLGLPDLSGYEIAGRLREEFPEMRLIAMTGWAATPGDPRDVPGKPFDHRLIKPVDLEALQSLLSRGATR